MSDIEFLFTAIVFISAGYGMARAIDAAKRADEREALANARKRAFIEARRPRLHPGDMRHIQELAELDDLRDYIRRDDAGA